MQSGFFFSRLDDLLRNGSLSLFIHILSMKKLPEALKFLAVSIFSLRSQTGIRACSGKYFGDSLCDADNDGAYGSVRKFLNYFLLN